ncbi:hypothetical protein [Micromonospora sp. CA-111912]|uniref:hypothetical protein n=1 Tax=Micromonospora sp. CA-111912 TaxID=3239955 RepID=UPI003D909485
MSVHDVARVLPDPTTLRDRCRALAVLDAALGHDPAFTYHRFDARWGPGEELASMDNGSGDEWSIVFAPAGIFVRGFDHESPLSPAGNDSGELWPGLVDTVPEAFAACVREPAFSFDGTLEATVCLWRETGDDRWRHGDVVLPADGDDGADHLFGLLTDGTPEAYQDWARDYYERPVDLDAVREVFALRPVTPDLLRRLGARQALDELAGELARIGHPVRRDPA